jgi:hypothetical protein
MVTVSVESPPALCAAHVTAVPGVSAVMFAAVHGALVIGDCASLVVQDTVTLLRYQPFDPSGLEGATLLVMTGAVESSAVSTSPSACTKPYPQSVSGSPAALAQSIVLPARFMIE